ncbi:MAG: hypothetical protein WC222_11285 [Parachlamydiales bacterium]|jgi:hypothetical protein
MAKTKTDPPEEKVLTGYEGTGKPDTFQDIGDDITLPGSPAEEKPVEEEKPIEEEKKEEIKLPPEEAPNNDEELAFLKEKKVEEPAEKEREKEEEKPVEEKDIFDVTDLEKELETEKTQKEEAVKYDWKTAAKKNLDIELAENDPDKFFSAVKTKIEESAQKIIPDTSKYSEDARMVVDYLEAGGKFDDLLNPLGELDKYIVDTDPDDMVRDYFTVYEGLKEDEADAKIEELHDDDKFDTKLQEVKKLLFTHRAQKASDIIQASSNKIANQLKEAETRITNERAEMVKVVDGLQDFMGMKLPDKAKDYIKTEISNGKLSERNNNARTQVYARLFEMFGSQIIDQYSKKISEEARKSFNTAKEQELGKLHNIPPKAGAESAQEHRASEDVNPLAAFINIDKDAIEME